MPEASKLPQIPNLRKEVIALFKNAGPAWMFAALVVCTLPWTLAGVGYCINAVAELARVLR